MTEQVDEKLLKAELEQFRKDKEKIRNFLGKVGGQASSRLERLINISFTVVIAALFIEALGQHIIGLKIAGMSPFFSIEVGLLLVSLKILWMIRKQTKVEHFQFWILNSIEFRVNDISKKLYELENKLEASDVEKDSDA